MLKDRINLIRIARKISTSQQYYDGLRAGRIEACKEPKRRTVINFILSSCKGQTHYLEIGVRNPEDNFKHILADYKKSVDPGIESENNLADYKMTSDEFFHSMREDQKLSTLRYDVIFIDGLHLADQAYRDIENALAFIKPQGYVLVHDCNPPSAWHARENYYDRLSPARGLWNGTTWKAFVKWRCSKEHYSCCIDTDFGIGILSKNRLIGESRKISNVFYEYQVLDQHRKEMLGLISFEELQNRIGNREA